MDHIVKVTFSKGNGITTEINGTKAEICEYYAIGKLFNLGAVEDDIQSVISVEFVR